MTTTVHQTSRQYYDPPEFIYYREPMHLRSGEEKQIIDDFPEVFKAKTAVIRYGKNCPSEHTLYIELTYSCQNREKPDTFI